MPSLTVAEKNHWKDRIAKRIDRKIEAILAGEPGLMDRVQEQARQRAVQSLGLADMQAELDDLTRQQEELERREQHVHRAMLAVIRRCPVEQVDECLCRSQHHDVTVAIQRRLAVHEDELLAADDVGQEILRLRREKDNLLDTVWLATSNQQIRELWQKVVTMLGEEQTPLQREALAISAAEAA